MSTLDLVAGFATMVSAAWYGPPIIPETNGTDEDYHDRYRDVVGEDGAFTPLGAGEFGEVRLVASVAPLGGVGSAGLFAAKTLDKAYTLRDNVLYKPPDPAVLRVEVEILRALGGKRHALRLFEVYEGNRKICLVTEVCWGGDLTDLRKRLLPRTMMDSVGVGDAHGHLLPLGIVKEVAARLLAAVDHCSRHGVVHRDIKPANVMLLDPVHGGAGVEDELCATRLADGIRLIDFGSGCIDAAPPGNDPTDTSYSPPRHSTMAGSAYYRSPESFRGGKSYTAKTDVWSVGVTVYVFAAGFPQGKRMQATFDAMHSRKEERDFARDLAPAAPEEGTGGAEDGAYPSCFWKDLLDEALLKHSERERPYACVVLDILDGIV